MSLLKDRRTKLTDLFPLPTRVTLSVQIKEIEDGFLIEFSNDVREPCFRVHVSEIGPVIHDTMIKLRDQINSEVRNENS